MRQNSAVVRLSPALIVFVFGGCISYVDVLPAESGGGSTLVSGAFAPLDAGAAQQDSLHFTVRAYGAQDARQISEQAEAAYNRIMIDTNLYSFQPRGLYQIVVYGGQDEYQKKTGQPNWSGGVSVGNAIYSFMGPGLYQTIAHEMTHLIFFEYMGRVNIDHRWVNEGLAVYEEGKALGGGADRPDIFAVVRGRLRQQPIPMDQMIRLIPATEREYTVNVWYAQAESMIRHMIERGGRIGFSQFLAALRDGRDFDAAVAASFPGVWRNLADFEQSWQRSLG